MKSEIAEFYKHRTVLVTGASGFMGKVLLEKLLYSCPEIKNIFILIRPKRGKGVDIRLQEMLKAPMFNRLRAERPGSLEKIVPFQGDVILDELGLDDNAKARIVEEVSIVFHGAATLRLDAKLNEAIKMNVEGTWRILQLCKEMKQLKVMIHVSTAFCHVDIESMEERVYNPPVNPHDIMRLSKWIDDETLRLITPRLLEPHPNSYTYSKRLAEGLVNEYHPEMPVAIARPSIVTPALKEPLPGWVDNLNGPVGFMVGGGKGVIRSVHCNAEYNAEVIPVDMAISGLIAIGWKVGSSKERAQEIPVYNLTQSGQQPITWGEILEKGKKVAYENPFEMMLWYPDGHLRSNKFVHELCVIFFHWIPAYLIDFLMLIFSQKRFMVNIQRKIHDGMEVLQYFTTRQWVFENNKLIALRESMNSFDRTTFNLEFEKIDIVPYLKECVLGARQYLMKEDLSTLPRCRKMLKVMYVLDRTTTLLFYLLLAWLIVSNSETARYLLSMTSSPLISVLPLNFFNVKNSTDNGSLV
uniref:Fatty acyl-CoA reductase n=1 Tax=Clastoptera arizonana TaxID=38151 RepID=A0A1B6C0C4_9HEMI